MTRENDDSSQVREEHIIAEVGGLVDETHVSLGISGPDIQPEEISAMLRCAPTSAHRRGDSRRLSPPYLEGAWLLTIDGSAPSGPAVRLVFGPDLQR